MTGLAVCGIQARMSSSRLPGKMLADVGGAPLIERVVERLGRASELAEVAVLTSTDASDDPLVEHCEARGIAVRRGSLDDVLSRYLDLARETGASWIVRITGDCPLVSSEFVDAQVRAVREFDADLVHAPGGRATLPGHSIISTRALFRAAESGDQRDREHVGSFWLLENRHLLRTVELQLPSGLRRDDVRLTIDEEVDLEVLGALFAALAPRHGSYVPLDAALAWLDEHVEVRDRNRVVVESEANRSKAELDRTLREPVVVGRWEGDWSPR